MGHLVFLMNRMSVGAAVLWYDASNIRQASTWPEPTALQSANNMARNLGCNSSHQTTLKRFGSGCNWTDFSFTWRYQF